MVYTCCVSVYRIHVHFATWHNKTEKATGNDQSLKIASLAFKFLLACLQTGCLVLETRCRCSRHSARRLQCSFTPVRYHSMEACFGYVFILLTAAWYVGDLAIHNFWNTVALSQFWNTVPKWAHSQFWNIVPKWARFWKTVPTWAHPQFWKTWD